ncbi:hypothetical protein FRAHR75_680026 [Frankia sp. Hr75.2]|nr:hypothetical protein FRAHR75_680026 [Frankia sp. Hr75.2]
MDTLGLLLTVLVVPASRQDRDGARQLLVGRYFTTPTCRFLLADGGFAGRFVTWAASVVKTTVEIVWKKEARRSSGRSRNAGSWNARWRGSPRTAVSSVTTNTTRPAPQPSSTGP